ncbi:Tetratricopeptide-like helical domain superfamily [Arabidopsis suecica]|uniref:Tetratricopeptide-like helical domain superfamily n=1 Tax=Arabidopsis suecica TaxID=45249 RepID=A0A8T2H078_ARASU|nr:Tetratricopeptide-like helical domain superfamily [Arabidopsis suecica]
MAIHPWWKRNRKKVDKYMKNAKDLITSQDPNDIVSALSLLNSTLSISPHHELALELKARSLLYLRRFKDVAVLLHNYIPSLRIDNEDVSSVFAASSELSSLMLLLPSGSPSHDSSFKCFSYSYLKNKVMAGLSNKSEVQGQWRYLVLGQACYHLGLMDDAIILLQTGKRLATAELRRESICWSEDSFNLSTSESQPQPITESEVVSQMLSQIKLFLRRRTAALAALNAGLYSESIRHFSKIIDSRRGAPQSFLVDCLIRRASAYKSAGRIADSIADCNLTLALEPSCIEALETRAELFRSIRCFPDSLHDLEHLKLLFNSILRDRSLTGPVWKRHNVRYREIPGKLCVLTTNIKQMKEKITNRENGNEDYYSLMGIERGCSRSELNRAYLLLNLRYKSERSMTSIDRFDIIDEQELVSVKNRARMSTLLLYRLIQKGYYAVLSDIETVEADKAVAIDNRRIETPMDGNKAVAMTVVRKSNDKLDVVVKGVFCRDMAAVGSLISRAGLRQPITV